MKKPRPPRSGLVQRLVPIITDNNMEVKDNTKIKKFR
jgi:hypothetical protein